MTVALHGDSVEVQGLGLERLHRRSRGTCSTAVRKRTTSYRPLANPSHGRETRVATWTLVLNFDDVATFDVKM